MVFPAHINITIWLLQYHHMPHPLTAAAMYGVGIYSPSIAMTITTLPYWWPIYSAQLLYTSELLYKWLSTLVCLKQVINTEELLITVNIPSLHTDREVTLSLCDSNVRVRGQYPQYFIMSKKVFSSWASAAWHFF